MAEAKAMPEAVVPPAKPRRPMRLWPAVLGRGMPGLTEIAGFGVLFLLLTNFQTLVFEMVHSLGHTDAVYSRLARIYDDGTMAAVPVVLAVVAAAIAIRLLIHHLQRRTARQEP